jgi:hypothetical protein
MAGRKPAIFLSSLNETVGINLLLITFEPKK